MNFSPLGSYMPGNSFLHRMRPGVKLLGLFLFATLAIAFRSVPSTIVVLAIAVTLSIVAGLRGAALWRVSSRFLIFGAMIFIFQVWQNGAERGFAVVGTLLALIYTASAFTTSTAIDDLIDTIVWALQPFRRFGVKPDQVALAFSLVISGIPTILGIAQETRSAARARGLERSPRAYLVPMVLRSVAHAQLTGEAMQARGLGDES